MLTFLCIILGIYLLGRLLRILLPLWIARKLSKFQQQGGYANFGGAGAGRAYNARGGASTANDKGKEGDVKITSVGGDNKRVKDKVGEYVDFDEVK